MAFFGLTKLGYQDTIREHICDPKTTPISAFRSGQYRDPDFRLPTIDNCDTPAVQGDMYRLPEPATPFTAQVVTYQRGPCGSNEAMRVMRMKGIVNPTDNGDIYRTPLTTSGEIGAWRKDEPLREKEPWSYVQRHIHLDSEMTRFVNEMAKSNPAFSLF